MLSPPPEDHKLLIRCPKCGQRFKVQPEFNNRMVECGVCEHHFRIHDDVIIRIKKFYPGEKHHHGLNRFQRILYSQSSTDPLTASALAEIKLPLAATYQPLPPQRILAGLIGVLVILAIGLLLIFGGNHGGPLDGMSISHKLIMAGFAACVGLSLLLYGNPNSRWAAALFGGAFATGLLAIPFFVKEGSSVLDELNDGAAMSQIPTADTPELDPQQALLQQIRERVGYRPLGEEIERLAAAQSTAKAYGLFLVGLHESNRIAVRDYMFRITSADPSSHIYPRGDGAYLFVLSGLDVNIERLASLASPLGTVRLITPELNIIEIAVNNEVFDDASTAKLILRDNPDFYELNLLELKNIDVNRIQRAVMRLAEAEPRLYRSDITLRLRELLEESGINFHGIVARALGVWDEDVAGAAELATRTVIRLEQLGRTPPAELVTLALERPSPDLIPTIIAQWRGNTLMWESYCIKMGPSIEQDMLKEFETNDESRKQSAVRVLSKVGGEESRIKLQAALNGAGRELEIIITQALENIALRRNSGE